MVQKENLWELKWRSWRNSTPQSPPEYRTTPYSVNPQTQKLKEDDDTRLLRELTEQEFEQVRHLIGNLRTEDLSFDNIFQGKKRLVLPFSPGPTGELKEMIKLFEYNGYKINWSDGTVEKEIETQKGPQIRKVKIGKILTKLVDLASKHEKIQKDIDGITLELLYYPEKEQEEVLKKELPVKEQNKNKIEQNISKDFPHYKDYGVGLQNTAAQLLKHWNEKGEYYRNNPEAIQGELGNQLLVLTRAPIDVLRMSDFDKITSCHSPPSRESAAGNSYYRCAVQEAQGHGPVAYVVDKNDIPEGFDWEQEEVFGDGRRGISGPQPLSRLRIRQYQHLDDVEYQLAIPENRIYGADFPNLKSFLTDFLREKQLVDDPDWEPESLDEFIRYGGSYEDTKDGVLFNKFFKTNKFPARNLEHDSGNEDDFDQDETVDEEEELVDQRRWAAEELEREIWRVENNDLYDIYQPLTKNFSFSVRIENNPYEHEPYIRSRADMYFNFSPINSEKLKSTNTKDVEYYINRNFSKKSPFNDLPKITEYPKGVIHVSFEVYPDEEVVPGDDNDILNNLLYYKEFLRKLFKINEQEKEIRHVVKKVLDEYGLLEKSSEIEDLKQKLNFFNIEEDKDSPKYVFGMKSWISVEDEIKKELPTLDKEQLDSFIAKNLSEVQTQLKLVFTEDIFDPSSISEFDMYVENGKISFDMLLSPDMEEPKLLNFILKMEEKYSKDIINFIKSRLSYAANSAAEVGAIEERNNLVNEVLKSLEPQKSIVFSIKR